MIKVLAAVAALAACGQPSSPEPRAKPEAHPHLDAGVPGITTIHDYDPASGMHLDEGGDRRPAPPPAAARGARPIDITLRSTPPGAEVAVDGQVIGTTPTYWPGEADGHEHEFTFALARHAVARFRFVPITSGVIHPRLEPIAEEPDAGVPDEPEPVPVPEPHPAPPPTVLTPDASTAPPTTDVPD
ncbi:MAG TPA: PEGA domain-containing protein [Kofleriaceae bacterium]